MIRDVPFAKFHGLGNDWLVVDGKDLPRSLSKFARAILHRRTGIGADGLLLMMPPRDKKHAARLRFFNPDGSEAEMSGNGIRCAAAFLAELSPARRTFLIETPAGLKSLEKVSEEKGKWLFRVGMGAPVLEPAKIPFKVGHYPAPINGYPLRTQQGLLPVTVTSLGNPHCSIFVADFASLDWANLGREIETNPLFPKRTNVEFVKVISRKEIAVRFWERGVGHTMSSGTGSCAATVASILNGLTARQVRVRTEAGLLQVAWPENGEILLTGPVERVGQGTYTYGCTGPPRPGFSPRIGKGGVKQATAPPQAVIPSAARNLALRRAGSELGLTLGVGGRENRARFLAALGMTPGGLKQLAKCPNFSGGLKTLPFWSSWSVTNDLPRKSSYGLQSSPA